MNRGELYNELVCYVRHKFSTRPNIAEASEDIVGEVFAKFYEKHGAGSDKENFGYLSTACIRQGYKNFKAWDTSAKKTSSLYECLSFLSDDDIVEEIVRCEETGQIFESLEVLKAIEKSIILGRYYGDLKFSELAENLGVNMNTVLSHHRRALEKLRRRLTRYL